MELHIKTYPVIPDPDLTGVDLVSGTDFDTWPFHTQRELDCVVNQISERLRQSISIDGNFVAADLDHKVNVAFNQLVMPFADERIDHRRQINVRDIKRAAF